ncbi:HTH-type transcriptional activator Btr [compost metagenome]
MKTGETITDLIISLRMEEAKRLLVSELALKTYEVGERVGYADPAYFNKVFKKVVGITPKEYRDRVRL